MGTVGSAATGSESRLIAGDGTPEAVWLAWNGLAQVRPVDDSICVPVRSRLVVVAPHPDDEVLACGGLIASHAMRGGRVLVVAVTDGEASHPGSSQWSPPRLAAARRDESATGLKILGMRCGEPLRLGIPDGDVAQHSAVLTARLKGLLTDEDLVVTTWRHDGHPDHEATAMATARACHQAGCQLLEAPVWMWHWSRPADPRIPWQQLHALPLPVEALARKQRALAAHVTQRVPRDTGAGPVLGEGILERAARDTEYFFV